MFGSGILTTRRVNFNCLEGRSPTKQGRRRHEESKMHSRYLCDISGREPDGREPDEYRVSFDVNESRKGRHLRPFHESCDSSRRSIAAVVDE